MSSAFTIEKLREIEAKMAAIPRPMRILESEHLVDGPFEDWSEVRAPSRAARRRRQGHPQRIRYFYKPKEEAFVLSDGSLAMHPAMARLLRERTREA